MCRPSSNERGAEEDVLVRTTLDAALWEETVAEATEVLAWSLVGVGEGVYWRDERREWLGPVGGFSDGF